MVVSRNNRTGHGMLTVTLLRHAKSSWDNPELTDFDRPLSHRGAKAARVMAEAMESNAITVPNAPYTAVM